MSARFIGCPQVYMRGRDLWSEVSLAGCFNAVGRLYAFVVFPLGSSFVLLSGSLKINNNKLNLVAFCLVIES